MITTWTTSKNSFKKNQGAKQPFSHWRNFIKKKNEK
jgi:hypothetical protein